MVCCGCGALLSTSVAIVAIAVGYLAGRYSTPAGGHGWGGVTRTLEEEQGFCPEILQKALAGVIHDGMFSFQNVEKLIKGDRGDLLFDKSWAGEYMVGFYTSAVHITIAFYKSRHSDSVPIPVTTGDVPTFRVGHVVAPDLDIDDPVYLPIEHYIPRFIWHALFLPGFNCYMAALRASPFNDMLGDDGNNSWDVLLKSGAYARKKDWVSSFYSKYTLWDGVAAYPSEENNHAKLFLKNDQWDDGLEKAIAFDLIGSHRIEVVEGRSVGGETLAFVLALNYLKDIPTRPGFGKYGCDMYFSSEGLPLMIVTTDGREVMRGDKDWQYWKFVWRSSLIGIITLADHLHFTHFHAGNMLARAVRRSLSQNHPLRRVLSIFTFGTIWVNNIAMHTLLGSNHVLHRSTPFSDFESLSDAVPASFPPITESHKKLFHDETYHTLPQKIKETPYYTDGRPLAMAIRRLVKGVNNLYVEHHCKEGGRYDDPDHMRFKSAMLSQSAEGGYRAAANASLLETCGLPIDIVEAYIWTVTGWHRHVGSVGDYYADPDLAAFGWKEGENGPRPKQTMLMTITAAFTSLPQPKLMEDYSHVFKGVQGEHELKALWAKFLEELKDVQKDVQERNAKRTINNPHFDPALVECSVAV